MFINYINIFINYIIYIIIFLIILHKYIYKLYYIILQKYSSILSSFYQIVPVRSSIRLIALIFNNLRYTTMLGRYGRIRGIVTNFLKRREISNDWETLCDRNREVGDVEQKEVEFYVISPFLRRAIFVSGPAPPVPRRGIV